jgi:alpha-D-ribose 1-methylphosphonate 5-triphosphate diphosphatase
MKALCVIGGQVLTPAGFVEAVLGIENGRFLALGERGRAHQTLDASGLMVLPGIIDLHGDAFERQIQPRPGIGFPVAMALRDTQAQLLANGISTAFHGITLSWEPGLRSLSAWRAMLDGLASQPWECDMRVHLRWEAYNLDALETALADIAAGHVHLLAFNDHTPTILRKIQDPVAGAKYSERAGMTVAEFGDIAGRVAARADEVPAALECIADAATDAGLPMASHDDRTVASREKFRALGARICEFPVTREVGEAARAAGDFVVAGCPNVVRGGSHIGWAGATELVEAGICNVLCSDYYYPSMLQAPFIIAARDKVTFPEAWALVSTNPASAAKLYDRGAIAPGLRADAVLVPQTGAPHVVATLAGGKLAYLSAEGWDRLD